MVNKKKPSAAWRVKEKKKAIQMEDEKREEIPGEMVWKGKKKTEW